MLALLLQALLPYAINQLGSIMYFYLLSSQGEYLQISNEIVALGSLIFAAGKLITVADAATARGVTAVPLQICQ